MKDLDIKILETFQIFGKEALEIFKKRGTKAVISDYAILLGGYASDDYLVENKETLGNRTGYYWTKTSYWNYNKAVLARVVNPDGSDSKDYAKRRDGGVRPALPFSSICDTCKNLGEAQDGLLEVEFGEYPGKAVSKDLQKTLERLFKIERLFKSRKLTKTGKKYTRDKTVCNMYSQKFQEDSQEEYEYNGKKYVRVKANFGSDEFTLSNGEKYQDGDYVWVEVEPIKWLVDKKNNMAVAERILFSGVQFKHKGNYIGGQDFENTDLKWFLDIFFSKEIIPCVVQKTTSSSETHTVSNLNVSTILSVSSEVFSLLEQQGTVIIQDEKGHQKILKV